MKHVFQQLQLLFINVAFSKIINRYDAEIEYNCHLR